MQIGYQNTLSLQVDFNRMKKNDSSFQFVEDFKPKLPDRVVGLGSIQFRLLQLTADTAFTSNIQLQRLKGSRVPGDLFGCRALLMLLTILPVLVIGCTVGSISSLGIAYESLFIVFPILACLTMSPI